MRQERRFAQWFCLAISHREEGVIPVCPNSSAFVAALHKAAPALLLSLELMWFPSPALAYRPFDGTDAAVADPGHLEIELQPAGALWEHSQPFLIAPATVFNLGLQENWEAVLQGNLKTPLSPEGRTSLTDGGVFLKGVLRPGSLQQRSGPSIATEFGVLLPESDASGVGVGVDGIVSQRWDWGTVHFNAAAALTPDHHADFFFSTIIEGPFTWKVRPVAEVFYEDEISRVRTISGLVGAIWQVRDNLAFDLGFRHALTNDEPVNEVRAGLTIDFNTGFLSGRARK